MARNQVSIASLVVLLVAVGVHGAAKDFPFEKVHRCGYGDLKCMRDSAEFILRSSGDGIPELGVSKLDPIKLEEIRIDNPGVVNLSLIMRGGYMAGLSKAHVNYVKGFSMEFDPKEMNEVEVMVPLVSIITPYAIDGKVFLFPIKGSGDTNFTFENLLLRFKFRGKPISRNEQLYFESSDMDLTLNTTRLHLHFTNLFNGDKFLNDQANGFVNRRWEDLFRELKVRIEASFAQEITARVNEAFGSYPYSDYFLPGPVPKIKVVPEVRDGFSAKKASPGQEPQKQAVADPELKTVPEEEPQKPVAVEEKKVEIVEEKQSNDVAN